jgi:predicted esterase YcpF (UPF0227 family)
MAAPAVNVPPPALPPVDHLIYLHGFRSGPLSAKAQLMQAWLAREHPGVVYACPQLPPSPREAVALILDTLAAWPVARTLVMGSSLGGWMAMVVAERLGADCRSLLINPAVHPARDLANYLGPQPLWHRPEEAIHFRAEYLDELLALQPPRPLSHPGRCSALIAQGDELQDWREMVAQVQGCGALRLLEGSDHGLSEFADHLPWVAQRCGWA